MQEQQPTPLTFHRVLMLTLTVRLGSAAQSLLMDTACGKDPPPPLCSLGPDVKQHFGKDALQHLIGCSQCDLWLTAVKTEAACTHVFVCCKGV